MGETIWVIETEERPQKEAKNWQKGGKQENKKRMLDVYNWIQARGPIETKVCLFLLT